MKKTNHKSMTTSIPESGENLSVWDWVLFGVLATFCFFSYMHPDIMVTGNRSWMMHHGITSFYDYVTEWTGGYGANYMPSTFILYAIWILPLRLLGFHEPEYVWVFRRVYAFWYKLLPLLFFFATVCVVYRLALLIGLGKRKSRICMYAFMTTPTLFFSQFIFSQYDIFTMFFLLLGLYFFWRNRKYDLWLFALMLGLSTTFKYFSVLIFLICILLREKRVGRIAAYSLVYGMPFALELLVFAWAENFGQNVFGFQALDFINAATDTSGMEPLSYVKLICVFLVFWAYFVHPRDRRDEIAWVFFLGTGVCFALFTCSKWNPQWLMFMAPFVVFGPFINRNLEKFLWLDSAFVVCFVLEVFEWFPGNVDDNMLRYLLWRPVFGNMEKLVFGKDYLPDISMNTVFAVFSAILLAYFVFSHPKYALDRFDKQEDKVCLNLIRLRFVLLVLLWTVPSFLAACKNSGLW